MEMKILVILIAGSLVVFATVLLVREYMKVQNRLEDVEKENASQRQNMRSLDERILKLEEAGKKRMPYLSQDEILNAMAALDALEHAEDFRQTLIQNTKAHLIKSMTVGTKREEK